MTDELGLDLSKVEDQQTKEALEQLVAEAAEAEVSEETPNGKLIPDQQPQESQEESDETEEEESAVEAFFKFQDKEYSKDEIEGIIKERDSISKKGRSVSAALKEASTHRTLYNNTKSQLDQLKESYKSLLGQFRPREASFDQIQAMTKEQHDQYQAAYQAELKHHKELQDAIDNIGNENMPRVPQSSNKEYSVSYNTMQAIINKREDFADNLEESVYTKNINDANEMLVRGYNIDPIIARSLLLGHTDQRTQQLIAPDMGALELIFDALEYKRSKEASKAKASTSKTIKNSNKTSAKGGRTTGSENFEVNLAKANQLEKSGRKLTQQERSDLVNFGIMPR